MVRTLRSYLSHETLYYDDRRKRHRRQLRPSWRNLRDDDMGASPAFAFDKCVAEM
jgi:hypothetical protein